MSIYDDRLLAARFAALAPEPLAGNWDDVLRRTGAARDDRRPLGRPHASESHHRRRFLVLLAAAILVVVVGTAAAFGIRSYILERGFIGLPPKGAMPSLEQDGDIVLHYFGPGPKGTHGKRRVWVYADGRVVWLQDGALPEGANPTSTGFLEQRLTAEAWSSCAPGSARRRHFRRRASSLTAAAAMPARCKCGHRRLRRADAAA